MRTWGMSRAGSCSSSPAHSRRSRQCAGESWSWRVPRTGWPLPQRFRSIPRTHVASVQDLSGSLRGADERSVIRRTWRLTVPIVVPRSRRQHCGTSHIQALFRCRVEHGWPRVTLTASPAYIGGEPMRKAVTALAAAATIAAATIGASSTADARCGGWWGPAVIGGFAAGAIVGSAFARPYAYGYYGYYAPAPVYPAPVYYDYYMPAPTYYGYYGPRPYGGCWRWRYRYRYRVC